MASPVFFLQSLTSCHCPPVFPIEQFDVIHPHFAFPSIPRLSNGPSSSEIFFPLFVQGFFLSNIFTTCAAHCNLLTCIYTLLNKNQRPETL
jgi:hypothetical protein